MSIIIFKIINMKKSLFILAILFCFTIVKGQNVSDTIFDDYFLPDFIDVEGCGDVRFYDNIDSLNYPYEGNNFCLKRGHYFFLESGLWMYSFEQGTLMPYILDRAQPCYTDTLLTIKGVAVGVYAPFVNPYVDPKMRHILWEAYNASYPYPSYDYFVGIYNSNPKGKLKIMNSTLEREIASTDIDTNSVLIRGNDYTYMEYYFDNPVNVNGLFYIVEDVTGSSTRLFNMISTIDCYSEWPALTRIAEEDAEDNAWVEWGQQSFYVYLDPWFPEDTFCTYYLRPNPFEETQDNYIPSTCQMYMFPIFAETDTTLGDGTYPDTNVCLYDVNVDRYSNVYPNPASDIVTIQSSFKVKEIEVHNALGQVVLRKEGKQNLETIDVSNLQSGAYIVRIKTQRGFANKKILIE